MTSATVEARISASGEIVLGLLGVCGQSVLTHTGTAQPHGRGGRYQTYERSELDWVRELVRADALRPGDLTEWNRETVVVRLPWDGGVLQCEWRNPYSGRFDGDGGEFWPEVERHARLARYLTGDPERVAVSA